MNALPILERELRVRARSRATYWTRFAVALGGLLVWLPQLMWSGPFGTSGAVGPGLLNAVVNAAFLVSCSACLLTADVISSERREGTLGLLLLTRVGALDVLVGKLGSAGLTSLCALVAFLPLLMVPVLAGGVTGGEAFRKALVLPQTLFLALAAGLWASAGGREWLRSARTALLLLAGVVLAPRLLDLPAARFWPPGTTIGLLSPVTTLFSAGAGSYKLSPGQYWASLSLVHATAWVLVAGAVFRLRRAWQEESGGATVPVHEPAREGETRPSGPWLSCSWVAPVPGTVCEGEKEAPPPPSRALGDGANPIAWLLQRQRGTLVILWAGALIGPIQYALYAFLFRFAGVRGYIGVVWPLGLVLSALESAMFAWAASRFFVEARRTGELELLLTTPCGAKELVSTQWGVLKRLLRWPMLVMLAPAALQAGLALVREGGGAFGAADPFGLAATISALIGCVNVFLGVGALCWVGAWFGLNAGGQTRAIVWTVGLVKGPPVLTGILCSFALNVLARGSGGWRSPPHWFWINMCLPQLASVLCYAALICLARRRLLGGLEAGEVVRFDLRQTLSAAARDARAAIERARHWTPS
jgi:hypothetical protein